MERPRKTKFIHVGKLLHMVFGGNNTGDLRDLIPISTEITKLKSPLTMDWLCRPL